MRVPLPIIRALDVLMFAAGFIIIATQIIGLFDGSTSWVFRLLRLAAAGGVLYVLIEILRSILRTRWGHPSGAPKGR